MFLLSLSIMTIETSVLVTIKNDYLWKTIKKVKRHLCMESNLDCHRRLHHQGTLSSRMRSRTRGGQTTEIQPASIRFGCNLPADPRVMQTSFVLGSLLLTTITTTGHLTHFTSLSTLSIATSPLRTSRPVAVMIDEKAKLMHMDYVRSTASNEERSCMGRGLKLSILRQVSTTA